METFFFVVFEGHCGCEKAFFDSFFRALVTQCQGISGVSGWSWASES